jgi:hypothetical protein
VVLDVVVLVVGAAVVVVSSRWSSPWSTWWWLWSSWTQQVERVLVGARILALVDRCARLGGPRALP